VGGDAKVVLGAGNSTGTPRGVLLFDNCQGSADPAELIAQLEDSLRPSASEGVNSMESTEMASRTSIRLAKYRAVGAQKFCCVTGVADMYAGRLQRSRSWERRDANGLAQTLAIDQRPWWPGVAQALCKRIECR